MRKILFAVVVIFFVGFFQNCKSAKNTYKAPTTLTYSKDIVPILQTSCTPCHFPPEGRKEALNSYEAVRDNIAGIIKRVKLQHDNKKFMPLRSKKPPLDDRLISVLETWQSQGMPK